MSDRLSKSAWIDHGLKTLAAEGPNGLKAGPLSTALNVSRGSFYWHFADLAAFHAEILRAWQERTTEQTIALLESGRAGQGRLKFLLRRAFKYGAGLDRAIRAWAATDPAVATAVAAVDNRRIAYIAGLLAAAGLPQARAEARARFLYWAYLGQAIVMDPGHASLSARELDEIGALFEH
ncbi:MAG: hypothetical protein JWR84_1553 [Caulobacter sp.]|nr:hypothetical protein [Caulobacter sp.]